MDISKLVATSLALTIKQDVNCGCCVRSLLEKNGFDVHKCGEGYLFHITDNLSGVIDDYDHFDERRKLLKSLFRSDLFQKYERYG